ncbi:MAG TPA: hypothetical protein VHS52_04020 [Acidimicrobiales bacterium]|jgi:hypothetical protein|nr:hypothetical protein [Acidimicrobiales bacterium]
MRHSSVEDRRAADSGNHDRRRERVTVLSGLPGPLRAGVLVMVIVVVGAAFLCQLGVLAPRFETSGGGGSPGPLQTPPGASLDDFPPEMRAAVVGLQNTPRLEWSVLENVSLRAWEVTAVDVPAKSGLVVVAFLEPTRSSANDYPDRLTATALNPALTRLPVTVGRGRHLVVYTIMLHDACAVPGSMAAHRRHVRPTVHVATPFGDRLIHPSQEVETAPPCPT